MKLNLSKFINKVDSPYLEFSQGIGKSSSYGTIRVKESENNLICLQGTKTIVRVKEILSYRIFELKDFQLWRVNCMQKHNFQINTKDSKENLLFLIKRDRTVSYSKWSEKQSL